MNVATSFVWVFFYGAFMSRRVLAEHDVAPAEIHPARLDGYKLCIRPRVNVARADQSSVYGAAAAVRREDLTRLYASLEQNFGLKYVPEAVLVETLEEGALRPTLCYIVPEMKDAPAKQEVINQLVECVREMNFPDWYVARVESFGDN